MFVQSKSTTVHGERNGVCLRSRRGGQELLVKWSNGQCRWVDCDDIKGEIRLIDAEGRNYENQNAEDFAL